MLGPSAVAGNWMRNERGERTWLRSTVMGTSLPGQTALVRPALRVSAQATTETATVRDERIASRRHTSLPEKAAA